MRMECLGGVCALLVPDRILGFDLRTSFTVALLAHRKSGKPGDGALGGVWLRNFTEMGITCLPTPQMFDDVAMPQSFGLRGGRISRTSLPICKLRITTRWWI